MKITDNIEMLEITSAILGAQTTIYPVIISSHDKLILVDGGYPGQLEEFKLAFKNANHDFNDLKQILITHHDIDHIGSVQKLKAELDNPVELLAYKDEIPYLDGSKTPTKIVMLEAKLDSLSEPMLTIYHNFKAFYSLNKINVNIPLSDGVMLEDTEITIIYTPGHTPGHICLYDKASKTLVSGDALGIKNGKLIKTPAEINWDNDKYNTSLEKLCEYEIETLISYHGGICRGNITNQIQALISK